jgi:hypothetical protein
VNECYKTTLIQTVFSALKELGRGDGVILLGPLPRKAAETIAAELRSVVPDPQLTPADATADPSCDRKEVVF